MPVRRAGVLVVALLLVLGACTDDATAPVSSTIVAGPIDTTTQTTAASGNTTTTIVADPLGDLDFDDFLEESYEILLLRSPQSLTSLGVAEQYGLRNDRLDDLSPEFLAETQQLEAQILDRLRAYDRAALTAEQQVSFDVYEWYLDQRVRGHRFAYHEYPVHHFVNGYNFNLLLFLSGAHPMETVEDAEDYVACLFQIDDQVAQLLERLAISEGMGVTPTQYLVGWTIQTLRGDLGGTSDPSRVRVTDLEPYTTFRDRLAFVGMDEATRESLLIQAEIALAESFVPAWVALIEHMEQVEPVASLEAGVWRLPDGDAYYQWLLRDHTSTDLTPDEIHQIGLDQVERVEAEMRAAFDELGYPADASLGELRQRARNEVGSIPVRTEAEVAAAVEQYDEMIAEAEDVLRPLFGLWPQSDVEVVPDPQGGGYYVAGTTDGSRPGSYHVGIGGQISLVTMATILYHEAVPGHHTQIGLAQELDLPIFRRYIQYNAFAEGWALYAERLAAEAGLYDDDPYGNIGRLELELLRAVRLVVDTGIHSKRWTAEEARAYMDGVVPGWSHEVERYMVLPGQATGYMIGQQVILGLRGSDQGDLVAFHDLVLGGGSMPLGVLQAAAGGG